MTKFLNISVDDTLGGNSASDEVVSSQKALKTYIDNHSGGGSVDIDNLSITKNGDDELQAVGVIDQNATTTALKQWSGTKAQYDALVSGGTVDSNTVYNITDDSITANFANTSLSNLDSAGLALFTAKLDSDKIQLVNSLPVSPVNGTLYLIPE